MPSSLSIYSSAPKTKTIFQFLWGILEGQANRAWPPQPILKNCQNGTFLPVDEIWNFFGPNDFIWSAMKVPFHDFIQNVSQALCLSKWWNGIKGISTVPYRNLEFLWIPSKTGRQNWRVIIFLSFNLIEWQCEPGPIAASDFSFIFRPCHSFYGHSAV